MNSFDIILNSNASNKIKINYINRRLRSLYPRLSPNNPDKVERRHRFTIIRLERALAALEGEGERPWHLCLDAMYQGQRG